MRQIIHFNLTQDEMRRKTKSNGDFGGHRPLCGNGSWHASTTRNPRDVNCSSCLEMLERPEIKAILYPLD